MKIEDVRKCLQEAHRFGSVPDIPEGTYYIRISDTLALHMIEALNAVLNPTDKMLTAGNDWGGHWTANETEDKDTADAAYAVG